MTARLPLVMGPNGQPEQLQSSDTLSAAVTGSVVYNAAQGLTAAQQAQAIANIGAAPFLADGCCRLSVASATSLQLAQYNGSSIIVNGVQISLPSTPIAISNSGLAANTLYYAYVTATPSLVLSTTGYSTDALGRNYMTGNAANRLVGMVYTNASAQFEDDNGGSGPFRGCLNWFNRRRLFATDAVTGTTTSSSYSVVGNAMTFLTWADEAVSVRQSGSVSAATGSTSGLATNYVDGSQVGSIYKSYEAVATATLGYACEYLGTLSEGVHTCAPYGAGIGGNYTFAGVQALEYWG